MQSRRFPGLPVIGILTVVYFIAGKLGLMLASLHASASPVWPPAGIALGALLVLGYRVWPAIFVGAFLVNVTTAGNVATSLAVASGNALEAVCGAWLVNRFAGGTTVFDRPQGVFKFALAAVVSAIISPVFGVTSLALAGFADWANYGPIWLTWWLGDTTGDLLIAPLVILWSVTSKRRWNRREAAEVGILLLMLFILSEVVFGGWLPISAGNYPIGFICGPIVIWTAFRFTQRETATGIFILSAIAIWGTLHGFGPFVRGTENQSLLALQWWTAVLSITAMALSAAMAERRRVEEELQQQKVVVETANRTKDHFLGIPSHELRTPLTPVISALKSLETEPAQTEENGSVEPKPDLPFEIAHLLLIDVVAYSKLLVNEQIELLQELNQIVRGTECFRSAEASGKLNRVQTGDGMALLFFHSPEEPVRCALEITRTLQDHPHIRLRMGVHSGPVNRITDVNDKTNFAGSGFNVAQRVLDCGDAGHILLSAHVAEDLAAYRHWQPCLHNLGECEVKHGLRLHLFNLCKDNLGNPQVPDKLKRRKRWKEAAPIHPVASPRWPRWAPIAALLLSGCALAISLTIFLRHRGTRSEIFANFTGTIPDKSIAVLPFENLSDDKQNAYFADGVQDEILTNLAKVADLKVISRTSVMQYKNSAERNLRAVGKALGVAHILEGTVQRVGGRVRVSAQLIDARTDGHLWAERYDREIADVFAIENELAEQIVAKLKSKLSPQEKAAIEEKPTADLAAYDLYSRARDLIDQSVFNPGNDLFEAVRLLEQALKRDPSFALGYYQLAHAHDQLYVRALDHTSERLNLADAAIQSLRRLRPDSGEAHLALAKHLYWGHLDYDNARKELAAARGTLPNEPLLFLLTGYIDRRQSRWDESLENMRHALRSE